MVRLSLYFRATLDHTRLDDRERTVDTVGQDEERFTDLFDVRWRANVRSCTNDRRSI